jgi:hypothetical protein
MTTLLSCVIPWSALRLSAPPERSKKSALRRKKALVSLVHHGVRGCPFSADLFGKGEQGQAMPALLDLRPRIRTTWGDLDTGSYLP